MPATNLSKNKRFLAYRYHDRFYNYPGEAVEGGVLRFFQMVGDCVRNYYAPRPAVADVLIPYKQATTGQEYEITWIGHSTFLIRLGHITILTDPIFGNSTPFFPRIVPPPIQLAELPAIDYVLISHNHFDHMDATTLRFLAARGQTTFLVPFGDKRWFDKRGLATAHELSWWQDYDGDQVRFVFLPAHHWSQRGLFDRNRSLWGSWMIEYRSTRIYFAGDTAYAAHFKQIGQQFDPIDVALMPIGPCEPRNQMSKAHVSPEQAGQAFLDLGARLFIPMHWGTYFFGTDSFYMPIERLNAWWQANQPAVGAHQLAIMKFGQQLAIPPAASLEHAPVLEKLDPPRSW